MGINKTFVSGNLTRDAEVRRTASGTAIVSFSMAINERRRNSQTGEWEDYSSFLDVTWFGAYAEKCAGSLTKGVRVVVEGKLRQERWEKDGQKHSKLVVIADEVIPPQRQQGQYIPPQQAVLSTADDYDIPF